MARNCPEQWVSIKEHPRRQKTPLVAYLFHPVLAAQVPISMLIKPQMTSPKPKAACALQAQFAALHGGRGLEH